MFKPLGGSSATLIAVIFAMLSVLSPVRAADNYRDPQKGIIFRTTEVGQVHTPQVIVSGTVTTSASTGTSAAVNSGSATIATGQATLSVTASQVVATGATRRSVVIRNHDATISIYVGATGVTSATGLLIKAGESVTINTTAAVFAVAASGTPTVSYLTESD